MPAWAAPPGLDCGPEPPAAPAALPPVALGLLSDVLELEPSGGAKLPSVPRPAPGGREPSEPGRSWEPELPGAAPEPNGSLAAPPLLCDDAGGFEPSAVTAAGAELSKPAAGLAVVDPVED
ncbi:MAG: hypothetical protein JO206_14655 [Solirubrobacterales bacterium]|nr:hypothetical protein [Solirubrobacterales bacterium]